MVHLTTNWRNQDDYTANKAPLRSYNTAIMAPRRKAVDPPQVLSASYLEGAKNKVRKSNVHYMCHVIDKIVAGSTIWP